MTPNLPAAAILFSRESINTPLDGHILIRTRELITIETALELEGKSVENMKISFRTFVYSAGFLLINGLALTVAEPTDGFTNVPLTEANFEIQRPYNVPLEERYSFENGIRKLWVYADDKSHSPDSGTQPRTEVRMHGLDYTSGVWQFEGYGFVPNGTSGATVVQIHGAAEHSSTIILRIYNGDMRYYSGEEVATNMYDRWFRVNLIHDVDAGKVTVYLDGEKKFETNDRGKAQFYFKCGVYAALKDISYYMESRWRDIKIYKK